MAPESEVLSGEFWHWGDSSIPNKIWSFRPFNHTFVKWKFVGPEVVVQEGGWNTFHSEVTQWLNQGTGQAGKRFFHQLREPDLVPVIV